MINSKTEPVLYFLIGTLLAFSFAIHHTHTIGWGIASGIFFLLGQNKKILSMMATIILITGIYILNLKNIVFLASSLPFSLGFYYLGKNDINKSFIFFIIPFFIFFIKPSYLIGSSVIIHDYLYNLLFTGINNG